MQLLTVNYFQFESSDIFSLGCVFLFVYFKMSICLFKKSHNENNVITTLKDLKKQKRSNEDLLAIRLLQKMLVFDTNSRATIYEVLRHAFFWNSTRWIGFLLEIGNKLEKNVAGQKQMRRTSIDPTLKLLQDKIDLGSYSVIGKDWKFRLDQLLVDNLEPWRFKKVYDGTKLTELIRAFRNKWTHKEKLNFQEKALFGKFTEILFLKYFTKRFPSLLMHVHEAIETNAKDVFTEFFSQHGLNGQQASQTNITTNVVLDDEEKTLTLCFNIEQHIDYSLIKNYCFENLVLSGLNFKYLERREDSLSNFLQGTQCKMVKNLTFNECNLDGMNVITLSKKLPNIEELTFRESRNIHENDILPKTIHPSFEALKHLHVKDTDFFDVFDKKYDFETISLRQMNLDPKVMNLISQQNTLQVLKISDSLEKFHLKLYQINFQLRDLWLCHDARGPIPKRNIANFIKTQCNLETVNLSFNRDQIIGDFSCIEELFDHLFQNNPIKEINFQLNCCMLNYLNSNKFASQTLEILWCRVYNDKKNCAKCPDSSLQFFINSIEKRFPILKQIVLLDDDQIGDTNITPSKAWRITCRVKDIRNFNWLSQINTHTSFELNFITNASDPTEKINLKHFEAFATNNMDLKELTLVFGHHATDNMPQRKFLQSLIKIILKNFRTLESLNIDSSKHRSTLQSCEKNLIKVPEYLREVFGELSKMRTLKKWKIVGFSKN